MMQNKNSEQLKRASLVRVVVLAAICFFSDVSLAQTSVKGITKPTPGSWSIVLLPDTQCYSEAYPEVFMNQTEWIAKEKYTRNIRFVLHLGDITQNSTHPEWVNARQAMSVLDKAGIPYQMASGNHDIGAWGLSNDRSSHFSDYFVQHGYGPNKKARKVGESENAYQLLTIGEAKFILLSLEFGPREAVVEWANEVIAKHPGHYAILVTHAYLYSDGTRYDCRTKMGPQKYNPCTYPVAKSPEGLNDGEQLWLKLVSKHPNFLCTFNGHDTTGNRTAYLRSTGEKGNDVHQIMVNYQCEYKPKGGGGFLRILEVQPDGKTVKVQDYSPYFDQWLTESERNFTIKLDRDINKPLTIQGGQNK